MALLMIQPPVSSAVFPSRQQLDVAVFIPDNTKIYEEAYRFGTQVQLARTNGYTHERYFIILDLPKSDSFKEAMDITFQDVIPSERVEYTNLENLAIRIGELFQSCCYTIFSQEDDSVCQNIKQTLSNETFCGLTYIPLSNEEEISGIDKEIESQAQQIIEQDQREINENYR